MMDAELLNDFVQEVGSLKVELTTVVNSLKGNLEQPQEFAKFSQLIDRIYGTAATFGFKELAAYCGMMKITCLECSKSTNKRVHVKVFSMLEACLVNLDLLMKGIHDPEAVKRISHNLHLESQKAKKLQEEFFQFTKK